MADELSYISNYVSHRLYTNPNKDGAYVSMAQDSEHVIGEIPVSKKFRIVISAFYVRNKDDYSTFRISKLRHSKGEWHRDGYINISRFQTAQIADFLSLLSHITPDTSQKTRIDFGTINLDLLAKLITSKQGPELLNALAYSEDLHTDIFAISQKRKALEEFREKLARNTSEKEWQEFFEGNPWIFGHGLDYVFLDKHSNRMETTTTGSSSFSHGKRTDALLRTRAEISQFVFVEIKRDSTELVEETSYRSGCWPVSGVIQRSVTQCQKTVYEFAKNRLGEQLKDEEGNDLGEFIYSIFPKSYLIVGNLSSIKNNRDKIASFELYRKNINSPEIITFDELYYRTNHMVNNVEQRQNASLTYP